MKFIIKHEMKGRMRVRLSQKRMTYEQADILQYYLLCNESVKLAKVYDRTCDAVINYTGDREEVIRLLQEFRYQTVEVPADVLATSGREVNAQYQEKLFNKMVPSVSTECMLYIGHVTEVYLEGNQVSVGT